MQCHLNAGFGLDITIEALASAISTPVACHGNIKFDSTKPDGSPRKLKNSLFLNFLGWKLEIDLNKGLRLTYQYFLQK